MSRKSHKSPFRSMPWLVIIAAIVILILITLTSTLVIQQDDDRVAESDFEQARAAALASEHAPTIGAPYAPVHIVEFLDPACETCAAFYPMVQQWLKAANDPFKMPA